MTTFLLIVSLFLNIIALLAIINLYLRQNRFTHVEKKQEKVITEMEEIISGYLVQMKEENESFIKRMRKIEKHANKPVNERAKPLTKEEGSDELNTKDEHPSIRTGKISASKAVNAYKQSVKTKNLSASIEVPIELPPIEVTMEQNNGSSFPESETDNQENHLEKHDFQEQLLLNQVLSLKKQGLSEEEIARKLNRGKTEIALLLKFNQNQQ